MFMRHYVYILGVFICLMAALWVGCSETEGENVDQKPLSDTVETSSAESNQTEVEGNIPGELLIPTTREINESASEIASPNNIEGNPNDWKKITWENLKDVSFEDVYYEEVDQYFLTPNFGEQIKSWQGQQVFISGYMIPITEDKYVLSANPFSSCFFCGNAGPESILELQFSSQPKQYFTDQWLTFKGEFDLNKDDIDHLNYILKQAEEYKDYQRTIGRN